jgi:hypothetical protein
VEFFGILRYAQDDGKRKDRFSWRSLGDGGQSRNELGGKWQERRWRQIAETTMAAKFVRLCGWMYLVGEGDVDGVAFDDSAASGGCLRDDGADGDGLSRG